MSSQPFGNFFGERKLWEREEGDHKAGGGGRGTPEAWANWVTEFAVFDSWVKFDPPQGAPEVERLGLGCGARVPADAAPRGPRGFT